MLKKPFLLMTVLLFLQSCSPVDVLNEFVPTDGYTVQKNIHYGEQERQNLDIYLPPNLHKNTPVALFFHGGSWQYGDKDDYLFLGQGLVSEGFIVVIANYRLYPEVTFPAFLEDNAKAVAWVHKHIAQYGVSNRNITLVGHSAGAYNAVMLALDERYLKQVGMKPSQLAGVVGLSGPYDFLPIRGRKFNAIFSPKEKQDSMEPVYYVRAGAPRLLLLTGDEDGLVSPENSKKLAGLLKAKGNDVSLIEYNGVGHYGIAAGFATPISWNDEVRKDIADFIRQGRKQ